MPKEKVIKFNEESIELVNNLIEERKKDKEGKELHGDPKTPHEEYDEKDLI